ncbi:hypothetical protein COCC4DRAFT_137752 [Bipolaris maydis ATCC 48331]|nr:uncharacterized protein COCC4DRAFT_137752 [Bipolaris maydis ATCC 48331]ENI05401.1 hypothetical protein COCC4DRAFT_137752 [Bipolaris maydis ATCC 48331]
MSPVPSWLRIYDEAAKDLFGQDPKLEVLLEDDKCPFAHEAGVFMPEENCLFVTSNQYQHPATGKTHIHVSRIQLSADAASTDAKYAEVNVKNVHMANGGVNYKDGILFCSQGTLDTPGGIAYMHSKPGFSSSTTYEARMLVSSFHGRPFNSPNDVVVQSDGSIWFTDPNYGWEQKIRPPPRLPNQVYRFDPATACIRAMADGFSRPNGICFSPDERIVYVTDTDWIHGDGSTDDARVSHIYAFDVQTYSGQPFLTNRRLFAMADTGVPDGIKCDLDGNVYSGCGDGLNIWSPGGVLLAKILVDGGVANFCFGKDGQVFLLNEYKLWRLQLHERCKGALLRL